MGMRAWKLFSRATPSHFPRISCFPRPFSCTASVPRFEPPRRQQLVGPKMATSTSKTGQPLDRAVLESVLRRRLFYTPSFEIYGGERGLFDYGPPGCIRRTRSRSDGKIGGYVGCVLVL